MLRLLNQYNEKQKKNLSFDHSIAKLGCLCGGMMTITSDHRLHSKTLKNASFCPLNCPVFSFFYPVIFTEPSRSPEIVEAKFVLLKNSSSSRENKMRLK